MKHLSSFSIFLLAGLGAQAQLTVTDSLSVGSIAQLLEGLNVSIQNVDVNCPGRAMGHFSGTSELAISEGMVLTTGRADFVAADNTFFATEVNDAPGDADLDQEVAPSPTYDACVLEFDCIPYGDTLLFNFSFGSEEYPEFVGSFNDVFAIYLTGPGFPTPTNVAALPDGTPVAINNVNIAMNAEYFYDNQAGNGQYVAYDGFTTNLTVFAEVQPDAAYHFKVAIADAADMVFDSGVFLEAFSFRSTEITTGIASVDPNALRTMRNGDQLTVVLPNALASGARIAVLDATGQLVRSLRMNGDRMDLDLAGLAQGIYTLQLPDHRDIAPLRFVK
ncbi:MAG: choice-of-anchor L domain-containing protein [Flavobacteriales bacterium]